MGRTDEGNRITLFKICLQPFKKDLIAPVDDWSRFWSAAPQPGFHDLIAMLKFKRLRLEGDLYPFMTHIRYFKDLLGHLRAGETP